MMIRSIFLITGAALLTAGCATVEQRANRFTGHSCAQLATALEYEQRAEREARRTGVIAGVASLLESGADQDSLELDSDMNFLDADDRRLSAKAIKLEQQRRCGSGAIEG